VCECLEATVVKEEREERERDLLLWCIDPSRLFLLLLCFILALLLCAAAVAVVVVAVMLWRSRVNRRSRAKRWDSK